MKIKFTKMQAYGNDYVYIFTEGLQVEDYNDLARKISDRHFGVGSDGMVLISYSDVCDFRMRIFNPDGTEAQMCGNALRSTAMYVYEYKLTDKTQFTIETYGGNQNLELFVEDGHVVSVHAAIGSPEFRTHMIPAISEEPRFFEEEKEVIDRTFVMSSISWGNPHTVIEIDDVDSFDVEKYGPAIEHLECFPERTNVTFAQLIDEENIKIREWERGTGETLGCGTGCCSAVVVLNELGKCGRKVSVQQPGGVLNVIWDDENIVHMIGPSNIVYEGEYIYEP